MGVCLRGVRLLYRVPGKEAIGVNRLMNQNNVITVIRKTVGQAAPVENPAGQPKKPVDFRIGIPNRIDLVFIEIVANIYLVPKIPQCILLVALNHGDGEKTSNKKGFEKMTKILYVSLTLPSFVGS